jgi:2'-5' RNA ligase
MAHPARSLAVQPPQFSTAQSRNGSVYQRPRTDGREECVYILTLKTSAEVAGKMGGLREKWFPQGRNKVPAHITLFHALPSSRYDEVTSHLEGIASRTRCFRIASGKVLKRRNGVAVNMGQGEGQVRGVYMEAKEVWNGFLSDQDRGFQAHWTVQNKEEDGRRVDEAFEDVKDLEVDGVAEGLVLWKYERDGRWTFAREFCFQGADVARKDSWVVDDTGPKT